MAEGDSGSSVGIVAIIAILLIIVLAGFFVMKSGLLGGGTKKVDVNISAPK